MFLGNKYFLGINIFSKKKKMKEYIFLRKEIIILQKE
jgi:hypothetical protein